MADIDKIVLNGENYNIASGSSGSLDLTLYCPEIGEDDKTYLTERNVTKIETAGVSNARITNITIGAYAIKTVLLSTWDISQSMSDYPYIILYLGGLPDDCLPWSLALPYQYTTSVVGGAQIQIALHIYNATASEITIDSARIKYMQITVDAASYELT